MKSFTKSFSEKMENVVSKTDKKKVPKNVKRDKSGRLGCYHKQGMKERHAFIWYCYPEAALEFQEGVFDAKITWVFDAKTDWLESGCHGRCPSFY